MARDGAAAVAVIWTRRGKKICHVTLLHPLWRPIMLLHTIMCGTAELQVDCSLRHLQGAMFTDV